MIRATIDRVAGLESAQRPIIVTNKDHADAVTREMVAAGYRDAILVLEPVGRNTAPAVAVAAHEAMSDGDPLLLVLPSDHSISDEASFRQAVSLAAGAANSGYLVTFGITPSRPETGYGYIRTGAPITPGVNQVTEFREKPDARTAATYIESGDYLWNSGMFLMKASRYLEELATYAQDIAVASAAAYENAARDGDHLHLDEVHFAECRAESIDFAVMESTSMAAVVPTDPGWSDVGSWASLWDIGDKDAAGNVLLGDVVTAGTSGSYVRSSNRLVATVGIEDMIVVDTPDAVLVACKDSAWDVKEIVDKLRADRRPELDTDGTVLRPWGRFRTIDSGPGYSVLHLWLDPGGRTSLTKHTHGSKHWLVVNGTARITTGETTRRLPEGQSVYIPPQETHRLANPGEDVLEVVEVNIGSDVGASDISRCMDPDGRKER